MKIMKVIKLNNRYTASRFGFTHAVEFEYYDLKVATIESIVRDMFGWSGLRLQDAKCWYAQFAKSSRKYRIYFKNDSDITMLLLKIG